MYYYNTKLKKGLHYKRQMKTSVGTESPDSRLLAFVASLIKLSFIKFYYSSIYSANILNRFELDVNPGTTLALKQNNNSDFKNLHK